MVTPTYATRDCDCTAPRGTGYARPDHCEKHGNRFQTERELKPKERTPLRPVGEKRQAEYDSGKRRNTGSTLKAGRGFGVAPAQRKKMKRLTCLGCGREVDPDIPGEWTIDPAHLVPRGGGGCEDPLCVIPLCRHRHIPTEGCHPIFDGKVEGKSVDLHPRLARGGWEKELAHAMGHGYSPLELLCRVTGEAWVPQRQFDAEKARVGELEAGIAP